VTAATPIDVLVWGKISRGNPIFTSFSQENNLSRKISHQEKQPH
jgi:hypothetical protein